MWQSGVVVLWMGLFACGTAVNTTSSVTASSNTTVTPSVATSPTTIPSPSVTLSPSTMMSPSTTVVPTRLPRETYKVEKKNSTDVCILMKAAISVEVMYPISENETTTVTLLLNSSTDPQVNQSSSFCDKDDSSMTIMWSSANHSFVLDFKTTKYLWELHDLRLYLNANSSDFPDIYIAGSNTTVEAKYSSVVFTNEFQRSYKCDPVSTFKLTTVGNTTSFNKTDFSATIKLKRWQVQAFEFRNKGKFGSARVCPQSQNSNAIVPIAVGAALGVLVAAVVVVYLLSRVRKRRLTSYEALN